jgi:excinuclease ABC subunit C
MMREVMQRRFENTDVFPDIILIDGGKGQLSAVIEVLNTLEIDTPPKLISIAKGEKRNAGNEKLYTPTDMIQLPSNDPLLFYLERLRDEAHRFAIYTHRQKRTKNMTASELKDLPNVGGARKKSLLLHFGSVKSIKSASIENLSKVDGIGPKLAKTIYNYFNPEEA